MEIDGGVRGRGHVRREGARKEGGGVGGWTGESENKIWNIFITFLEVENLFRKKK